MFVGLFGKLVSAEVIAFAVGDGGGAVGVGCEVVKLGDSKMWARWHSTSVY
jgi:hypothetical protein